MNLNSECLFRISFGKKENSVNGKTNTCDLSLYKYVSLNDYYLDNLRKGLLFLRTASFFNDKFDSAPFYSKAIFDEMLQDNINSGGLEDLKKTYAAFDDDYRRRILSHIVKDAMD
ncbi:MAG: hypothetical protein PHP65_01435 [Bacilli bacterium]|nr:hypothetical protein [Bacilli bacterium]